MWEGHTKEKLVCRLIEENSLRFVLGFTKQIRVLARCFKVRTSRGRTRLFSD